MEDEIWIVTKRGSIKSLGSVEGFAHPEWMAGDITLKFDTYEDAYGCMKKMMRSLSSFPSNVFDGEGGIHGLNQHLERIQEWRDIYGPINENRKFYRSFSMGPDYSYMGGNYEQAKLVPSLLKNLFLEQEIPAGGLPQFRWTDWTIAIDSKPDLLKVLYASPTPPLDGYNPNIEVRGFAGDEPGKEKVLHIHNEFGQDPEFVGSLDIRLWKTTEFDLDCNLMSLEKQLENEYENGVGFELERKIPGLIAIDSILVEMNGELIPKDLPNEEQVACYKKFVKRVANMAENKGFVVDRRYWIPEEFKHAREEDDNRKLGIHGRSRVHCYRLSEDSTMVDFSISIKLITGTVRITKPPPLS